MTHFLQRTALIALATGALGACSSDEAMRPSYPTHLPETSPPPVATPTPAPSAAQSQPTPALADAPITAAPAAPVELRPLAPLAPARSPAVAQAAPPAPTPVSAPAPGHEPIATYRSVTTRSVTGRVVEVEGREVSYRVKKGDTLEDIADTLDTSVSQLREDNGLKKRAKIHPGEVLKGPRSRGHAYVAESGDTLYSIARRFNVTAEALRDENDLSRDAGLHPGERVRLPEGYRDRGPLVSEKRVRVASSAAPAADAEQAAPEAEAPPTPVAPRTVTPAAAPAAVPTYRTVTTRSVTGRVVEVEGRAVTYKVKRGDSLEKIARKLDTTVTQLREDNDLGRHEKIQPGDTLQGPRSTGHAYVASAGDTLYSIARRFGVTPEALRDENDFSRNASLHPGEKVRLPEGYHDHGPLTSTSRVLVSAPPSPAPPQEEATAAAPAPRAAPRPYTPPATAYAPPPAYTPPARIYAPPPRTYTPPPAQARTYTPPPAYAPPATAALGDAEISVLGRGRFVWPLQGPIVTDFGPQAPGQRNDGLNIGAEVGAPVKAAAAGDVVYAGDQVPGFGNLVLIKHADGWVTAYGHLSRVLVKMQQKVVQGEEIGLAGATGGVSEPQLHFEIRYASSPLERAKPVDPKLVLPQG